MRARLFQTVLATAFVAGFTSQAFAAGVSVPLDEVRMVSFAKPVATVYVGNAMVADVNIIDSTHAFLLGKAYGVTNMIALDAAGKEVENRQVTVLARSSSTVTVNRGGAQMTYACAGARCEPAPVPGDSKDAYNDTMQQIQQHQEMGVKSASAAQ